MSTTPAPRIYVLPRRRIVWVWIAKSGCTSILHMLSHVNGGRPGAADASAIPEWSPELVIHDHRVHGLTKLERASAGVRRAAMADPGWWRFAVVRAPHARFVSAWLDKVFLRAPGTPHLWGAGEDVVIGDGRIDVTATFSRFVEEFARSPARFFADRHFTPQHASLSQGLFADLEVIPMSQFARVPARLASHTGRVCDARRFNESLDIDLGRVYDPTTVAVVADCYRDDLRLDPGVPVPTPVAGDHLVLTRLEADCVRKLRAASLRIRQLARLAILPGLTVRLQRLLRRR